jgi:hypothetical protein
MIGNIFRLQANIEKSENLILTYESLIKILNNRGPKAEPYGTLETMGKSGKSIITRTNKNLDVK